MLRSEEELMHTVLSYAEQNEFIQVVGMEGSRVHPLIEPDKLQDFDLTFVVTDKKPFQEDESWLTIFGKRIFMQKPESMTLYHPQLGNWLSYLLLLEEGHRVDITIVPIEELDVYLSSETLIKILLDKKDLVGDFPLPTNQTYHIKKPSVKHFDDCCNEFWWVSTYVSKGLYREEMTYAANYLNQVLRQELYRMLSWKVGFETDFSVSIGKYYRFLEKYVSEDIWARILKSYKMDTYEEAWQTLFEVQQLFRDVSKEVAGHLHYPYPNYDENITRYTKDLYEDYQSLKALKLKE